MCDENRRKAQPISSLKVPKLSAVLSNLESQLRQARGNKEEYTVFLLNLSELKAAMKKKSKKPDSPAKGSK